jgi:hypothetical protein
MHFGMVIVGLDYGHAGQMTLDEITGGSVYGATTIAGGDGSRQPTANELTGARYQGRGVAEVANNFTTDLLGSSSPTRGQSHVLHGIDPVASQSQRRIR